MMVRMLNPSVGETSLTSSPRIRFTIVVLPALSSPLHERSARAGMSKIGRASCRERVS